MTVSHSVEDYLCCAHTRIQHAYCLPIISSSIIAMYAQFNNDFPVAFKKKNLHSADDRQRARLLLLPIPPTATLPSFPRSLTIFLSLPSSRLRTFLSRYKFNTFLLISRQPSQWLDFIYSRCNVLRYRTQNTKKSSWSTTILDSRGYPLLLLHYYSSLATSIRASFANRPCG